MNFEALEQLRYETTKKVMESMAEVATDKKQSTEDRIAAAKVVDSMSDSIIKARLLSEQNQTVDKATSDLSKQIKDLEKE